MKERALSDKLMKTFFIINSFRYLGTALLLVGLVQISRPAHADTVNYEFTIGALEVNFTGESVTALAIDGQIPAPTIRAKVGDILRVTFHNSLDEISTVHWHGILLPPGQDGVAYLNTRPIEPRSSFTFEFPIIHDGTFWYHSHTDMQIQRGLYGAVVLTDPADNAELQEEVVVFSDWTDENVDIVLDNLKSSDDYYSFARNTVQSWNRVLANGSQAVRNRLNNSLSRMGPMDLADVYYDAFLVNGQTENSISLQDPSARQMKLRLVNGSTSSYFDVEYAGGPMTVVAADGQDVEPIRVQRLRMSTAETYDVLVPLNSANAYELRATSIDGTGYSRLFVGNGNPVSAPDIPQPNLYLMEHDGMDMGDGMQHGATGTMEMTDASMPDNQDQQAHNHEPPVQTHGDHATHQADPGMAEDSMLIPHLMDYENLVALQSTALPDDQPWREISLTLSGTMERYVWGFDGYTMREIPQILVRRGENVRLHLSNETMMHHPIHLHGHFFRVVNQHGARSPLKHTVNVPPMANVTIEFDASENQDWLLHCHNQYHMKSGMNRVISYEESSIMNPVIEAQIQPNQRWFDIQEFHLLSSFGDYEYSIFDERHEFRLELDTDLSDTYETHLMYAYHFNRFVSGFVGTESREHHHGKNHDIAMAGVNVLLPLMIESQWRVDDHGEFRLELESEFPLTRRLGLDWRWNTDDEYRYGLNYRLNSRWAITVHTDTEYGDGIGIKFFY